MALDPSSCWSKYLSGNGLELLLRENQTRLLGRYLEVTLKRGKIMSCMTKNSNGPGFRSTKPTKKELPVIRALTTNKVTRMVLTANGGKFFFDDIHARNEQEQALMSTMDGLCPPKRKTADLVAA